MHSGGVAREHDDGDLGVAEDGELASFLEYPISSFRISHLPVRPVLNHLALDLSSSHFNWLLLIMIVMILFAVMYEINIGFKIHLFLQANRV